MAISGYAAAWLVMALHVPFGWALLVGFALGGIIGFIVLFFIGDAPTFAVVIVGFTFIFISRTVIENLKAVGGTMGMFGLPNIGGPDAHRWIIMAILAALLLFVAQLYSFTASTIHASAGPPPPCSWTRTSRHPWGSTSAAWACSCRRQAARLREAQGVLYGFIYRSLHLGFFHVRARGNGSTVRHLRGRVFHAVGDRGPAPILYGVPLLLPPAVQEWRIVIYGAALVLVLVLKPEGFITRRFVVSIESFLSGTRKKRNTLSREDI